MLTFDQFDTLIEPITAIFSDYETVVIIDIARRIANLDYESAGWETQRLTESGALYSDVLKRIAAINHTSEAQIADVLKKAGVTAIKFDDSIYKDAGLKPLPLNMSPAMADALKANIQRTNGLITNLTKTTALSSQQSFLQASTIAHLQVSTGTMSYNQAVRYAVKLVAAQGVKTIDYASGHRDNLDVATRRAVLTGVSQTASQLQMNRADELGSDLVAVSAHAGARNKGVGPMNHASWQGKIYKLHGETSKYPNFAKTTGYGTVIGIAGANCRHSWYPYFEGISENAYTRQEVHSLNNRSVKYQGQTISLYEATQIQRAYERKIRFWKRQADALKAIKADNRFETGKVYEWQAKMRDFINQVNRGKLFIVDREYEREQI
jgi:hypothetical protein